MYYHFIAGLLYILALTTLNKPPADTIASSSIKYTFVKGSTVTANGETNVKPFSCVCFYDEMFSASQVTISFNSDNAVAYFKNAVLKINIEGLDCGNNGINNDLYRALKSHKYPYIFVRIKDAGSVSHKPINFSKQTGLKVDAEISLAGVTRQDTILMEGTQIGENLFHFTGQYSLNMKEFGIKPPTALFGMIKVRNIIIIRFDLKVKACIIS